METSQRRVGRPKATPRTRPLVLGEDQGRKKVTLEISERAADELAEYARWVELSSSVATKDALFMTVDFALRDVFRRDRLWQEKRRKAIRPEPLATATPQQTQLAPTASLPPPASSARPVPSPTAR
jgi:hypothetical protein